MDGLRFSYRSQFNVTFAGGVSETCADPAARSNRACGFGSARARCALPHQNFDYAKIPIKILRDAPACHSRAQRRILAGACSRMTDWDFCFAQDDTRALLLLRARVCSVGTGVLDCPRILVRARVLPIWHGELPQSRPLGGRKGTP